jgi:nucleoside-diphosphate-sugar epimerase
LEPGESRAALVGARSYDAVIDTLAFGAADAADLRAVDCGHLVVISTASVYADDTGNGFETGVFPHYPDPIPETQALVPPGAGYSASKVALELALQGAPVTILRPAAIHGIGARHPREFWFVRRALDKRRFLPLEGAGRSVFHTTSTLGMASFVRHCLSRGIHGTFNIADPVAPSVAEVAALVAGHLGWDWQIVPTRDLPDAPGHIGHTPLSTAHPVRLSMAKARATGWDGGPDYAACLPRYLDGLVAHAADWRTAFPVFTRYGHDPFDYAAEDAALSGRA